MKIQLVAMALLVLAAVPATAEQGDVNVQLREIEGLTQTGQRAPEADAQCFAKYHRFIGQNVETIYKIDTTSGMMIARSEILGEFVLLHPLGLTGSYSFMSDGVNPPLSDYGIHRVLFSLTLDFSNPESTLLGSLNSQFQCKISSAQG